MEEDERDHTWGIIHSTKAKKFGRKNGHYLLSQVGTAEDELKPLIELQEEASYSAKYLAMRAKQGELPALRARGERRSSKRALSLYMDEVARPSKRRWAIRRPTIFS